MNDSRTGAIDRAHQVRITEVYASVQGESTHAGRPCTFVRLTGCPLRCTWCDSTYTFKGGDWRAVTDVLREVEDLGIGLVEVTGGEPLAQRGAATLLRGLLAAGHEVLLETSGSLDVSVVPSGVRIILDLKAPDSGEVEANLWTNLERLDREDEIKIVLASRDDYVWARDLVRGRLVGAPCPVLLSPAWGLLEPRALVEWILEDGLDVRLNLQQHKVIWDAETVGV